jgi:cytochrome c556
MGFDKQAPAWIGGALACGLAFAGLLNWHALGFGQTTQMAYAPPPPRDTIVARKTAMGMIDLNMDEVEEMLEPGATLDSGDARDHLDTIAAMLQAFPHLFPATTNQWKPKAQRDPALDTFASPLVWDHFDDFYARAGKASKLAFDASRAKTLVEFRANVGKLRVECNACHASYLEPE